MGIALVLLGFIIGSSFHSSQGGIIGIVIALAVWFIMLIVSLTEGGSMMLSASNAKLITPDVHPQLYNIVEEMRLAAGLNFTPKIYIIDAEAPNAFATGTKPENSAIAVTSGLLKRLNRDELQGVVAHEMSHIYNRDIRYMTIAGVMMGSIVLISGIFLRSMWFTGGRSSNSDSKGGGQIIMIVIALVVAILAPIMAQLLYFSLSRKREYLADASAARLTRYPEGLASALEKISNSTADLPVANKVTAPLYICNPLKKEGMKLSDLTSTHPPTSERIRILRAMAGGSGFLAYQNAYNGVSGSSSLIIPKGKLSNNENNSIREGKVSDSDNRDLKTINRETKDILKAVNQYTTIECGCGVKFKVPQDYSESKVFCPRCGREHKI